MIKQHWEAMAILSPIYLFQRVFAASTTLAWGHAWFLAVSVSQPPGPARLVPEPFIILNTYRDLLWWIFVSISMRAS
jgi:hypothetical protein